MSSRIDTASGTRLLGCGLYALGTFLFAVNDALGKWLVGTYGPAELMLVRSIGAGLVLAFLIWRKGGDFRIRGQYGLHLLRVACLTGDTFCFYSATRWLPLADVMTFYMACPLIVTLLSVLVLRERVGRARWFAVLVGFAGVLVVLQPGTGALSFAALIALAGSVSFSFGVVSMRLLRATDWLPLVTYQFAFGGLVGGALTTVSWVTPTATDVPLMFLVGIVSMTCFMCITRALSMAPASLVAPIQYTAIVWAILLGLMLWGDWPSPMMLLGNVIIIASGLLVVLDERRSARAVAAGTVPAAAG